MANEYVRKRMVLNNFKQNSPLIKIRGLFCLFRAYNNHKYNCKFNYIKFTYSKSISGTFSSNNSLKNSSTASFELI